MCSGLGSVLGFPVLVHVALFNFISRMIFVCEPGYSLINTQKYLSLNLLKIKFSPINKQHVMSNLFYLCETKLYVKIYWRGYSFLGECQFYSKEPQSVTTFNINSHSFMLARLSNQKSWRWLSRFLIGYYECTREFEWIKGGPCYRKTFGWQELPHNMYGQNPTGETQLGCFSYSIYGVNLLI